MIHKYPYYYTSIYLRVFEVMIGIEVLLMELMSNLKAFSLFD